ncbi:hypothetical protein QEN19_001014 [Hanseniaspora menglaensis]
MNKEVFYAKDINTKYLNIKTDKLQHCDNLRDEKNIVAKNYMKVIHTLRKTGWMYIGHFPCQLLPMFDSGVVYLLFNLVFVLLVYTALKYAIGVIYMVI